MTLANNSPNIKTRTYLKTKANNIKISASSKPSKSPANKNTKTAPTINKLCKTNKTVSSRETKGPFSPESTDNNQTNSLVLELIDNNKCLVEENKSMTNKQILSENKLNILTSAWLSDEYISFYFDILELKVIGTSGNIHLLNPAIVHGIKTLNDFEDFLEPHKIQESNVLILPINDGDGNILKEGGSHWSVLAYSKIEKRFYYYDSIKSKPNLHIAKMIISKISKYLSGSLLDISVIEGPVQENSYDCGIYTVAAIECIIQHVMNRNPLGSLAFPEFSPLDCIKKRSFLAYVIVNGFSTPKEVILSLMTKNEFSSNITAKTRDNVLLDNILPYPEEVVNPCKDVVSGSTHSSFSYPKRSARSTHRPMNTVGIKLSNQFDALKDQNCGDTNVDRQVEINRLDVYPYQQKSNVKGISYCHHVRHNNRILVLSDSQGKNLYSHLKPLDNKHNVMVVSKSGATLKQIVNDCLPIITDFTQNDYVVLLAGTNDVDGLSPHHITVHQGLSKLLNMKATTNIIVSDVPYRYDSQNLNDDIWYLNSTIKRRVNEYRGKQNLIHCATNEVLQREHFTRHGLHYNQKGKSILAKTFANLINIPLNSTNFDFTAANASVYQTHKEIVLPPTDNYSQQLIYANLKEDPINLIEANMSDIIINLKTNKQVAFAHCISGDLWDKRQMSAGVATAFKKEFGKPLTSEYITDYLAHQEVENGASVFALVTKKRFFLKPNVLDYDTAFEQFVQAFQRTNHKHLICSPMGCVRDNIPLSHFAKNISNFQKRTSAYVHIALHNEQPNKMFKHGQTYSEFVNQLRLAISEQYTPQLLNHQAAGHLTTINTPTTIHNPQEVSTLSSSTPLQRIADAETPSTTNSPMWHGWPTPTVSVLDSCVNNSVNGLSNSVYETTSVNNVSNSDVPSAVDISCI